MPAPKRTVAPSASIHRRFAAPIPGRASIGFSGLQFLGSIMTADNSFFDLSGHVKGVRFETLAKICEVRDCRPGGLIEYKSERQVTNSRARPSGPETSK